ncbi:iron-containing alcohol dehydrogenase [Bifidobacterium longum]|uniref:iron-containing alcohol dehydrogenase n=1 Tax=Bifidobacterium longum TaxID=216816 RepID=UPI00321B4590
MRDFIFHNPVKIYFGKGQARHIAQEVERVEGAVLVVYGGGSIKRNGAYDDVMAALAGTGHKIIELPGVTPNPRLDKALEGVRLVKEHGVGLILAVGGGSVIDCAKFISLGSGIGDDEDLWDDYIETGKPAPEGLIPVGVVLTTAATGSEMGDAAVLTNWERNRKLGYTSFPLMPRFSVLDPSYLMTLPAEQTVYGFEDMFCHTCEQYFSYPVDDNLSDEIAEGIQRHILRSWRACLSDPKDYEARSNAMWDSTLALNRIISRGKEEDWVTHGIEHALSAYTDIAHGAGLAVVHPHWMAYVYLVNDEVTARFARWAVDVWGVTPTGKTDRTVAEEGIDRYVDFLRRVGAPLTLSEAGGSFVQIHRDDARAILEACKEPVSF